jgi:hypothetical protein
MASVGMQTVIDRLRRVVGGTDGRADDALLLARFAADRDAAAFEMLLVRHGPMVRSVCARILRHEQDAEDAFQATFLALAKSAGASPAGYTGRRITSRSRREPGRSAAGSVLHPAISPLTGTPPCRPRRVN